MINAFDKIANALKKTEQEVKSIKSMKDISEKAAEMVRTRVRERGMGVSKRGGSEVKLAPLAASTIKQRKRKRLHQKTSPSKSNLTETGKMLDALYGRSTRTGKGEISIKSRRSGSSITNDEIAFFVSGKRPFIDLSNKEIKDLEKIVEEKTTEIFNKMIANINR